MYIIALGFIYFQIELMKTWQMRAKERIMDAFFFCSACAVFVSVAYAAISWPSAPDGETVGGKYVSKLVPSGAIMAFKTSTCPSGWSAADGTNGNPDLRGEFIRGWDNGRGVDAGRTNASYQSGTFLPQMYVYRSSASAGLLVTPSIASYPTDGSSTAPYNFD